MPRTAWLRTQIVYETLEGLCHVVIISIGQRSELSKTDRPVYGNR